jgi:hypothetical protein
MRQPALAALLLVPALRALAGPPYLNDDPATTPAGHYEVYLFAAGADSAHGQGGAIGVDFNFGAAPDLQLTAVLPYEWDDPAGAPGLRGLSNIELAAKYRFLHQSAAGVDVALFPRLFLPSASHQVGERHAALLLPVWLQRSGERWASFGGGGCELHPGQGTRHVCMAGWAVTWQVTGNLQMGAELQHATPDAAGARASTALGLGLTYDLGERWHMLASAGPGIQNTAVTARTQWYAAFLLTL